MERAVWLTRPRASSASRACASSPPGGPLEERDAEFLLEGLDMGADGGLAGEQAFGGAGEVAFLGHRNEGPQVMEIHGCPPGRKRGDSPEYGTGIAQAAITIPEGWLPEKRLDRIGRADLA